MSNLAASSAEPIHQEPMDNGDEPVFSNIEIPIPDVSQLIIQDDTPVDNVLHEKQMRLLTEPLYTSWQPEKPFLALANVGLFHEPKQTPVVPDVMLSTDVQLPDDWREHKEHLSYFVWERGKVPDVVIEIVSNAKGNELGSKMERYARVHVPFYLVFDPEHHIQEETLTCFVLLGTEFEPFPPPYLFKKLGIGLTLWQGSFENQEGEWLRWTFADGSVIPTGAEAATKERLRANEEHQRANEERLRADEEHQRADEEHQRANEERLRADEEHRRANEECVRANEERLRAEAAERRIAELEARLKSLEA